MIKLFKNISLGRNTRKTFSALNRRVRTIINEFKIEQQEAITEETAKELNSIINTEYSEIKSVKTLLNLLKIAKSTKILGNDYQNRVKSIIDSKEELADKLFLCTLLDFPLESSLLEVLRVQKVSNESEAILYFYVFSHSKADLELAKVSDFVKTVSLSSLTNFEAKHLFIGLANCYKRGLNAFEYQHRTLSAEFLAKLTRFSPLERLELFELVVETREDVLTENNIIRFMLSFTDGTALGPLEKLKMANLILKCTNIKQNISRTIRERASDFTESVLVPSNNLVLEYKMLCKGMSTKMLTLTTSELVQEKKAFNGKLMAEVNLNPHEARTILKSPEFRKEYLFI